jgi:hypothetical protein
MTEPPCPTRSSSPQLEPSFGPVLATDDASDLERLTDVTLELTVEVGRRG